VREIKPKAREPKTKRCTILLDRPAMKKLRAIAAEYQVPVRDLLEAYSHFTWRRSVPGDSWLRVADRHVAFHIVISAEVHRKFREIARDLALVSFTRRPVREPVGVVLQAIMDEQITTDSRFVVKKRSGKTKRVAISKVAWTGLKEQFGPLPSTKLNKFQESQFVLLGDPLLIEAAVRSPRSLRLTPEAVRHMAQAARRLGLGPKAYLGTMSWVSLLLEGLGRGIITVQPPDPNWDPEPIQAGELMSNRGDE
jgi:hypothetical protein